MLSTSAGVGNGNVKFMKCSDEVVATPSPPWQDVVPHKHTRFSDRCKFRMRHLSPSFALFNGTGLEVNETAKW